MDTPSPIRSFLAEHDLWGKTIVLFCTHKGYGRERSFDTVRQLSPRSRFLEGFDIEGERAGTARPDVRSWLQTNGLVE